MPQGYHIAAAVLNIITHNDTVRNVRYLLLPLFTSSYLKSIFADFEIRLTRGYYIILHSHLIVEECLSKISGIRFERSQSPKIQKKSLNEGQKQQKTSLNEGFFLSPYPANLILGVVRQVSIIAACGLMTGYLYSLPKGYSLLRRMR